MRLPARKPIIFPYWLSRADYSGSNTLASHAQDCSSVLLLRCSWPLAASTWNDPYPAADRGRNILYSAFTDRPKHLDPVQSYSEDEITFTAQIYQPPLQYHYLKRPTR